MKNGAETQVSYKISRDELIKLLNEDLAREYQAISHALIISNQIDYLGGMPGVQSKPVRTSEKAKDMLNFDLTNEGETIRNYRERVRQCEQLGEYAMAEHIREILKDEQDHQIALATALGEDVPIVKAPRELKKEG